MRRGTATARDTTWFDRLMFWVMDHLLGGRE